MTRVEFVKPVDVDIHKIPGDAYGMIRTRTIKTGPAIYYFPQGARPALPDDMADGYIASGDAIESDWNPPTEVSINDMLRDLVSE